MGVTSKIGKIQELFLSAVSNRINFISPYNSQFSELQKGCKKRAEIVSTLLIIEPSHLIEPWINEEIQFWLRTHGCEDFIEMALLRQKRSDGTKRGRKTSNEVKQFIRDFALYFEIERLKTKHDASTNKAFTILESMQAKHSNAIFPQHSDKNKENGIEKVMEKRYYLFKKQLNTPSLPYPYFGKDVTLSDDGFIVLHGNTFSRPGQHIAFGSFSDNPIRFVGEFSLPTPIKVTLTGSPPLFLKTRG